VASTKGILRLSISRSASHAGLAAFVEEASSLDAVKMATRGASMAATEFNARQKQSLEKDMAPEKQDGGERISPPSLPYFFDLEVQLPALAAVAGTFLGMLMYPEILSLETELTTNSSA